MERYPSRNWGVIYQQGWTVLLKDKMSSSTGSSTASNAGRLGEKETTHVGSLTKGNVCMGIIADSNINVQIVQNLTTVLTPVIREEPWF